jgi:hypothetical protein
MFSLENLDPEAFLHGDQSEINAFSPEIGITNV